MGQLEPVNMPRIIEVLQDAAECVQWLDGKSDRTPATVFTDVAPIAANAEQYESVEAFEEAFRLAAVDAVWSVLTGCRRDLRMLLNDGAVGVLDVERPTRARLGRIWRELEALPREKPDGTIDLSSELPGLVAWLAESEEGRNVVVDEKYSKQHYTPKELEKLFPWKWATIKKRLDSQTIRNVKHGNRDYQIHVDDLPDDLP